MSLFVEGLRSVHAGPFSFEVPTGQCLAITGASGSGKTLLLRMLADLDPHEGAVSFEGVEQASLPAAEWRRRAGLVPARSGWWADNVSEHFPAGADATYRRLAEELFLPERLFERPIEEASTGERQRLALIRALVAEPRLLLLDEPTASLDPASTRAVETVISRRMAGGATVIWVTHDAAQAARVGDHALKMQIGGVLTA